MTIAIHFAGYGEWRSRRDDQLQRRCLRLALRRPDVRGDAGSLLARGVSIVSSSVRS